MLKSLVCALLVACVAVLLFICNAQLTNNDGSYKKATKSVNASDFLLACHIDNDLECLEKSTVLFLSRTSNGIPDYNILAIDPFVLPSIDIVYNDKGLVYINNNVIVTGLEQQKIYDFKMNTTAKSVVLTTKADIEVVADIILIFTKLPKILLLRGISTSFATVLGTAEYNYDLKTNEEGVEHFEVSPETITVKIVNNTHEVKLNSELEENLSEDNYAEAAYEVKQANITETVLRAIVKRAYKNVIHNIREGAKILPASAFFNNLHSE